MAGITLRCRNDHDFVSQAKPGNTVACPACRREGRGRISCRVPMRAAELAGRPAPGDEDSARLAAAWSAESPPVSGRLGADAAQPCQSCGGPMYWTVAHTAVMCPACPAWSVSQGAAERAAVHGHTLETRAARSRGLAVRTDEAAERAARVALRSQRETVLAFVGQLEEITEPGAHDRVQYRRLGFEIGARLRSYRPEIAAAELAELEEIAAEIMDLRNSDQFRELASEAEQVAQRRDQQQAAIEQAEAQQARQIEAQRQAEHDQRQAEAAERQRRAAAPRRTSAELAVRKPSATAVTARLVAQRAAARTAAIQDKGACGFKHAWAAIGVPADRLYGVQVQGPGGPMVSEQHPSIRACAKHYAAADRWMADHGVAERVYWEL